MERCPLLTILYETKSPNRFRRNSSLKLRFWLLRTSTVTVMYYGSIPSIRRVYRISYSCRGSTTTAFLFCRRHMCYAFLSYLFLTLWHNSSSIFYPEFLIFQNVSPGFFLKCSSLVGRNSVKIFREIPSCPFPN